MPMVDLYLMVFDQNQGVETSVYIYVRERFGISYESKMRILVDPTSDIRSSQRLSHACLSTN
jgi:hypothetical protein